VEKKGGEGGEKAAFQGSFDVHPKDSNDNCRNPRPTAKKKKNANPMVGEGKQSTEKKKGTEI